jgi:PAS domain S-box-containing protein
VITLSNYDKLNFEIESLKQENLVLKRKLDRLRNSKTEFQGKFPDSAINAQRDTLFVFDPESGKSIVWNRAFSEKSGYTDEEISHLNAPDSFYSETDLKIASEGIVKIIEEGETLIEMNLITKNGKKIPFEYLGSQIKDDQGKLKYIVAVGRDITEHKKLEKEKRLIEESLIESEKRYRLIVEQSLMGVAILQENVIKYASTQMANMYGYTVEELLEMEPGGFLTLFDPEYLDLVKEQARKKQLGDKDIVTHYELKCIKKSGERFWVENFSKTLNYNDKPADFITNIDITERKEAEQKLKESEERFRNIIENSDVGYFFIDTNGIFQHVNKSWLQMHKFSTPDEIIGKHFSVTQVDNDLIDANKQVEKLLQSTPVPSSEFTRKCKDGSVGYHTFSANTVIRNEKIMGLEGFIIDTTDRKKNEEKVSVSERLLNQAQAIAHIGHWNLDVITQEVSGSDEMFNIFGLTNKDNNLNAFTGVVHPDDLDYDLYHIQRGITQGESWDIEHRLLLKDGTVKWVHAIGEPEKEENDKVHMIMGTIQDITERKKNEQKLIKAEKKFRRIVEAIPDLFFLVDENGLHLDFKGNDKLLHLKPERILGKTIEETFPDEIAKKYMQAIRKTLDSKKTTIIEFTLPVEGFNHEFEARNIFFSKNRVANFVRDITEQKQIEELRTRNQKIESLGVFAGGLAHDFNNILTAIIGNLSILKHDITDVAFNSDLYDLINETETAAFRARNLTNQLLTFSKGGKPNKKLVAFNKKLIKEFADLVIRGSSVICKYIIVESLWAVHADIGQLGQVIQNLVINAIQASKSGSKITINAKNLVLGKDNIKMLDSGNYISISIEDEGVGIPKENLKKIFDPYFTTKKDGSGLGLSVCLSIVKQHKGTISVYSEENKGSAFTIYLPAKPEAKISSETFNENSEEQIRGKLRILVLEDEEQVVKVMKSMFKRLKLESEFTNIGENIPIQYEKALKNGIPFDVVILDLTIPGGIGGEEAIKLLLRIDPTVKVILSTGYASGNIVNKFTDYGFSEVLSKPYTLRELVQCLNRVSKI